MKSIPALLVLAVLTSPALSPALADAATATSSARYTLDTPFNMLVADPKARAVLDTDLPGLTSHAQFDAFRA